MKKTKILLMLVEYNEYETDDVAMVSFGLKT